MHTEREMALVQIRANIERFGHHVYLVQQSTVPRFTYTIGLSPLVGTEIFLAGGICFMAEEVIHIINEVCSALRNEPDRRYFEVESLGSFELQQAHDSWSRALMLGASNYYQRDVVHALQIVPDQEHVTIDVPNCSQPWSVVAEPIWQWLHSEWQFTVPSSSMATTDLYALRGRRVVEAVRWEEDQWELFSGPGDEFASDHVRIVPIGTLLAFDQSLVPVTELDVGKGLLRNSDETEWTEW